MFSTLIQTLSQLLTWFVVVAPWEQALRIRLGKHTTVLTAGIYFRIPFIDRVYRQSIRRRLHLIRAQTLTTSDGKVITIASAVGFEIKDLRKLFDCMESPNDTIENEVAGIVSDWVGRHSLKECTMQGLQVFVMSKLNLSNYGLNGQEFYITSFATAKTYRFITGDMQSWSRDGGMNMGETKPSLNT